MERFLSLLFHREWLSVWRPKHHAGGTGYRSRIRDKKLLRRELLSAEGGGSGGIDVTYRPKLPINDYIDSVSGRMLYIVIVKDEVNRKLK